MDEEDNQRKFPRPIRKELTPHAYTKDKFQQEQLPKAPLRALKIKGDQLRAAMRNGNQLDWSDLHERYIDLWQEARLSIWRAKHQKGAVKSYDPHTLKEVQSFFPNEKLVLMAVDTTRGILDSLVRLRREMGHEGSGIPRWAIERIERGLRNYPEAQHALLKELASENEKMAEEVE